MIYIKYWNHYATQPPSTFIDDPLISLALSEQRNEANSPKWFGSTALTDGCFSSSNLV